MLLRLAGSMLMVVLLATQAAGAIRTFNFSGFVLYTSTPGTEFADVTGAFSFDPASAYTGSSRSRHYPQTIADGFWVTAGPRTWTSSSYGVEVTDWFMSDLGLAVTASTAALDDGTPMQTFDLFFGSYQSGQGELGLPTSLGSQDLSGAFGITIPQGSASLGFMRFLIMDISLAPQAVPEPTSGLLAVVALIALSCLPTKRGTRAGALTRLCGDRVGLASTRKVILVCPLVKSRRDL